LSKIEYEHDKASTLISKFQDKKNKHELISLKLFGKSRLLDHNLKNAAREKTEVNLYKYQGDKGNVKENDSLLESKQNAQNLIIN